MNIDIAIDADEALVALLRQADHSDLAALVKFITDDGAGRLTLPAVVREVLIKAKNEKRFLDGELRLLVRELQLFGGNSLRNVTRGGGVEYRQVAADVLDHVCGEKVSESETVEKIELRVFSAILEQSWESADADEKRRIGAATGLQTLAAATNIDQIQTVLRKGGTAATNLVELAERFEKSSVRRVVDTVSKQVSGSVGKSLGFLAGMAARAVPVTAALGTVGWGAQQLAGEAYRITLPFVARIALIRQKAAAGAQRIASASGEFSKTQVQRHDATAETGQEWRIGVTADRPIVSATVLADDAWKTRARAVSQGVDRWSPILQALPGLGAAVQQSGSRYVRVVVNGDLAKAADGNGLRGFVRGDKGIVEHARFFDDPKLQSLVNASALFNVASALVAQKHLADISRRLESIEKGVTEIQNFQKEERYSEVKGTITYLKQVAGSVLSGSHTPVVRQKLEDFESSLMRVQHHLESDLSAQQERVQTMKDPSTLGTGGMTEALHAEHSKLLELISQWTLCHSARMSACQLVSEFSGEERLVQDRQRDLMSSAEAFYSESGPASRVRAALTARTINMSSLVETKSETYARQLSLQRWQETTLRPSVDRGRQWVMSTGKQMLSQEPTVAVLALRMDEQGCVEAFELDQEIKVHVK